MKSNSMKRYEIYNNSNKKSPKTKKQRNTNLSYQTLSAFKKSTIKKEKYQINCSSQTIDRKELKNNNNINHENEEEFSIIQSLWDDLGVYPDYQEEFRNYIYKIKDEEQKNEILNLEKDNLRKYREALLKLSIEISNRENNIFKIKKYCKELDKYSLDKDNQELPLDLFENIQKAIKYYRINTVNVINKIMKLREISSYYELSKKWDPSMANRSYLYNKNYILLMFNDIKFINNSILFNFLETDNQINKTDLFLSNCKNIITNNGTKIKIPISLELQSAINKCKYIILQDTLFNKIKKEKKFLKQTNFFTPKTIKVEGTKPKKSTSEISLVNDKGEKKYYEMFGHNKVNLSRTLYYLKRTMGNDYEKMFFNAQNNKNSDKKNMETMNKFFSFKPNNNEIKVNHQNKNNDIKVQYSEGKNIKNKNENNLMEQNKKNNEDIKFLSNESNINKTKSENINNVESNLENTTHKENKINNQNNTPKKEELNIDNNEENISPIKKGNKELNNEEIKEIKQELNNEENQNNKKENEINENNNNNINNDFHEEKLEEENNKEKSEIQNNNNIEKLISANNNKLEESEMIEKLEEKEKLNESNKEIKKEEENNDNIENKDNIDNIDNNLNEENKKIKTNESIEENDKKIENEIKEEKSNGININNDIKNKEQDELEEKNIDEDNKQNTEIKEEKNIDKESNKEEEKEEENYEGEGQFEEITPIDKDKIISKESEKENLNKSKEKEENTPKVKLLQYRKYSEEEIKKINKDEEDDDEFFVDYKNI